MNIKLTEEIVSDHLDKEEAAAKRQAAIQTIETACIAFNDAKKEVFDSLTATIEAVNNGAEQDVIAESSAALRAIFFANTKLNDLHWAVYGLRKVGFRNG